MGMNGVKPDGFHRLKEKYGGGEEFAVRGREEIHKIGTQVSQVAESVGDICNYVNDTVDLKRKKTRKGKRKRRERSVGSSKWEALVT